MPVKVTKKIQQKRKTIKKNNKFVVNLRFSQCDDNNNLIKYKRGIKYLSNKPRIAPLGYLPNQLRQAYNINNTVNKPIPKNNPVIAIVNAYKINTVASDLKYFCDSNGLPQMNGLPNIKKSSNLANFNIYYQTGSTTFSKTNSSKVPINKDWGIEINMDVQYAHSIAPYADIALVLAKSASIVDMANAVKYANSLPNVVCVSMSWGANESSYFIPYDNAFTSNNIIHLAASGDDGSAGGIIWPSSNPNVLSIGGTKLNQVEPIVEEEGWVGSGGGVSTVYNMPSYQINKNYNTTFSTTKRLNPDISCLAYPSIAVYNTSPPPRVSSGLSGLWGGTSLATPMVGAMIALAIQTKYFATNSSSWSKISKSNLYNVLYDPNGKLRDITSGTNGSYTGVLGYDLVTGNGSPLFDLLYSSLI